ncbi:MAG: hypothetical protein MUC83_11890 [Pirellula sp.]|jgi:hypothetical protein|nr:hypothetical protein [Pirellula sp.]
MKIPIHAFVTLLFVTQAWPSAGVGQDYGSEIVDVMISSNSWLGKAWEKSVELKVTKRTTEVREMTRKTSRPIPDIHYDAVNQLFIRRNNASKDWSVSRATGRNQLNISIDQTINYEQNSNAVYAVINGEVGIVLFRLPQETPTQFVGNSADLLEQLFDAEVSQLTTSTLSMQRKPHSSFLDFLVDYCLDPSNKSRINKSEELVDGVNRIVYRISIKYSDDTIYGIRIVVSESGFDKGLMTEIHFGHLKKEELKASYLSEEQLQTLPNIYTKTKWQEFAVGDASDDTIVVPLRISKREDSQQAIKSAELASYDFDWKPLSEESKQKINLEEAKKKAQELAKDIDKILNR